MSLIDEAIFAHGCVISVQCNPVLRSLGQDQAGLFLREADPDLPSLVFQVPVKVRPSEEIVQVCVPE